jgi:MscS family membrane protein
MGLWGLAGWQWVSLAVLLPLGWLLQLAAAAIFGLVLRAWLRRRRVAVDRKACRRVALSLGAVATALFWYYAVKNLGLPEGLLAVLLKVATLVLGVTAVWVGYRCVDIIGGQIAANREVQLTRFDDVLIPLLRKILRLFIVLVALLLVLDWMGYKPTTVLGVAGIGGVALAFAAQDTLGNFFGSITVLFDRPFGIGDWIVIGDVEGMVERVGFRSTRVRTFYNSVITIPNSKMVNTQLDNYGARRYRRAKIMLSVTYATPPEKIEAFCEGIRELIRLHPYTRKDYYHVYFNKFAASSLDILLYTFFEAPDWATELRERHRLFLDILRLANRLGVEFAFPTQTVWLKRAGDEVGAGERVEIIPGKDDAEAVGLDEAARLYEGVHGPASARPAPVVIDVMPRSRRGRQGGSD